MGTVLGQSLEGVACMVVVHINVSRSKCRSVRGRGHSTVLDGSIGA